MLQCSGIPDIFSSLPLFLSSFENSKTYPTAILRHLMATAAHQVGSSCLPNDKHSLGQVSSGSPHNKSGDEQSWFFLSLIKLLLSLLWKAMMLFQGAAFSCQEWQRCFHLLYVKMSEIHLLLWPTSFQRVFLE